MPDGLPPPPFWRIRYFAQKVINKPGRQIDPAEISVTLAASARRVIQPDGGVRHWRWVASRGHWLRVVTEADGVHCAQRVLGYEFPAWPNFRLDGSRCVI